MVLRSAAARICPGSIPGVCFSGIEVLTEIYNDFRGNLHEVFIQVFLACAFLSSIHSCCGAPRFAVGILPAVNEEACAFVRNQGSLLTTSFNWSPRRNYFLEFRPRNESTNTMRYITNP